MLKFLRLVAIAEGISYLSFAITVPLKKWADMPAPNYFVGQTHGFLFILFCVLTVLVARKYKWSTKNTLIVLASSLVPFGTFITEKKYMQDHQNL